MRVLPALLVLLLATPALAAEEPPDEPQRDHPLDVRLDIDLPIFFTASLSGGLMATNVIAPEPAGFLNTRRELNPLDFLALDTLRPNISTASDIAWIAIMAAPVVDHLVESAIHSAITGTHFGRRFGSDLVIYGEAMAINMLATELLKYTAQRPRPLAYFDPADIQDGELRADLIDRQGREDSAKSFVSGHTSGAFTAAATWSMLMTLKHPDRPAPLVLTWGLTMSAASAVGVLRVVAGKHHPTDVIAGAILGTTIGVLTPLAHKPLARKAPPMAIVPMISDEMRGAMVVGLLP